MAKTQAERAREYRKRMNAVTEVIVGNVTKRHENVTVPERDGVTELSPGFVPFAVIPEVTVCKTCGTEVNHHLIDMCLSCVQHAPSVKIGKE